MAVNRSPRWVIILVVVGGIHQAIARSSVKRGVTYGRGDEYRLGVLRDAYSPPQGFNYNLAPPSPPVVYGGGPAPSPVPTYPATSYNRPPPPPVLPQYGQRPPPPIGYGAPVPPAPISYGSYSAPAPRPYSPPSSYRPPSAPAYSSYGQQPPSGYPAPVRRGPSYGNYGPASNYASRNDGYGSGYQKQKVVYPYPASPSYSQPQQPDPYYQREQERPFRPTKIVDRYWPREHGSPAESWGKWYYWYWMRWNAPFYNYSGKKK